ncbi:ParE family toxin-like protein [Salinivibrio sharmensis]|uniref:ParE-like toxin domain-containing protein n=1 Tax=Salinivibrio sharmensis TaxID=390883 RepID=A0ABX3KE09_9GAMM|nr:hypothetical protein [Salinivibrio sharmensis]OOE87030.1 hypothetical protein BZG74_11765 [Salinivibrio sharmensis]
MTIQYASKGIDRSVVRRAEKKLAMAERDPKRMIRKLRKQGSKVIEVGMNYRLIDHGKGWRLVTHSQYNREVWK